MAAPKLPGPAGNASGKSGCARRGRETGLFRPNGPIFPDMRGSVQATPTDAASTRLGRRLGVSFLWLIAVAACGAIDRGLHAAEPGGLPPAARIRQRTFSIPFSLPKPSSAEAAPRQVVMDASRDLGATWQTAGQVAPSAGSFTYTADADGEYWFRLRTIDSQGRLRGGEGPDTRVVVDAAGPKLVGRAWKGGDGEVICRFAATDDSVNLESVVVEYRSTVEPQWKRIAAQPVLARESPAHLLGEEIWWAGEKTDGLVVRVTLADASGNPATKQFALEPADPKVDQATLARELGVPTLPGAGGGLATSPSLSSLPSPALPAAASLTPSSPDGWPAERAPAWSPESIGNPLRRSAGEPVRSVLSQSDGGGSTSQAAGPLSFTASRPATVKPPATEGLPGGVVGKAGGGFEYRGRPLQMVASRKFAWDYELPEGKPAGRMRVELWGTRDGGVTWQRFAQDEDNASPIDVTLAEPGLYGFRLEITNERDTAESPRSGELPDSWLGVDETAPEVEILSVARDEPQAGGSAIRAIVVRYSVRDPLLLPQSTGIDYAPGPDGPFVPIADRLDAVGEYRWIPDRGVPARVHLRVTARDAAGNVGKATTSEEVVISAPRSIGRLGGVRASPAEAAP